MVPILVFSGPLRKNLGRCGDALRALMARLVFFFAIWHLAPFLLQGFARTSLPLLPFLAGFGALSVVFAGLAVNTRFSVLPTIQL